MDRKYVKLLFLQNTELNETKQLCTLTSLNIVKCLHMTLSHEDETGKQLLY